MTKKNKFKKDYLDFVNSKESTPRQMNHSILDRVKHDLTPDKKIVFLKLISLQLFVGLVTMLFCPQFNLSLTNNYELFHYFHHTFGSSICMLICGAIFLGSGAIASAYILDIEEVRIIRKTKGLYYLAISALYLGLFFIFGARFYLEMTMIWVIGASLAATLVLAFNDFIRRKYLQIA